MDILNNPWVTGIGGGIISSLIVFFVTKYLFNKKENKEYQQKIKTANNEILYSIRPLVIEKKLPNEDIISAIKISIAKKYGIKQDDLYTEFSLYNDLVMEIMENSFLSSEQKLEFCELLKQMINKQNIQEKIEVVYIQEKNSTSSKYSSMLLALSSFTMVLITTLYITKEIKSHTFNIFEENISLFLLATLVPILAMMITSLYGIAKRNMKQNKYENNNNHDNNIDNKNSDNKNNV